MNFIVTLTRADGSVSRHQVEGRPALKRFLADAILVLFPGETVGYVVVS